MAKKSFKDGDNPAMAFISNTQEQPQDTEHTYKTHETKSKRLNILMKPSLHRDLEKIARVKGISLNELINRVLKEYYRDNLIDLTKYAEIWGDK